MAKAKTGPSPTLPTAPAGHKLLMPVGDREPPTGSEIPTPETVSQRKSCLEQSKLVTASWSWYPVSPGIYMWSFTQSCLHYGLVCINCCLWKMQFEMRTCRSWQCCWFIFCLTNAVALLTLMCFDIYCDINVGMYWSDSFFRCITSGKLGQLSKTSYFNTDCKMPNFRSRALWRILLSVMLLLADSY